MRLRTERVSSHELGDELVVLDLHNSRYFSVSGVGIRLFELLSHEQKLGDLVATLTAEFDVDAGTAEKDVRQFLEQLRTRDLLEDTS